MALPSLCSAWKIDVQRNPLAFVTDQSQGIMRALADANATPHAELIGNSAYPVGKRQCTELAELVTLAAALAEGLVNPAHVAGGRKHGNPVAVRTHGTAAAGTTVADGIETAQHGILEKGVMHMAAGVLLLENPYGLLCRDVP